MYRPILILMETAQAECCCYGYLLSLTQLYITSIDLEPGSVGSSGNACVSEMGVLFFLALCLEQQYRTKVCSVT